MSTSIGQLCGQHWLFACKLSTHINRQCSAMCGTNEGVGCEGNFVPKRFAYHTEFLALSKQMDDKSSLRFHPHMVLSSTHTYLVMQQSGQLKSCKLWNIQETGPNLCVKAPRIVEMTINIPFIPMLLLDWRFVSWQGARSINMFE